MANAKKKTQLGNSKSRIKELLISLEKSGDPYKSRKIRAALRKLGHKGGLNHPKKKKAKKVVTKKKNKKKTAA